VNLQKETLLKFYKITAIPTFLFELVCWTFTKRAKHKQETMCFVRAVTGYKLHDHKVQCSIKKGNANS